MEPTAFHPITSIQLLGTDKDEITSKRAYDMVTSTLAAYQKAAATLLDAENQANMAQPGDQPGVRGVT